MQHSSLAATTPRRISLANLVRYKATDPWDHADASFSPYTFVKLLFTGLVLFPIRFLVLLFLVAIICTCSFFGTLFYKPPANVNETQPLPWYRRMFRYPIRWCARGILWCVGVWWIREKYHKGSKAPCQIIVANHVNYLDALYMVYFSEVSAVAKAEVLSWPLFGSALRLFQAIPVDRAAQDSKTVVRQEIERRSRPGSGFPPVLVFPEGTTSNGRVMIQFKTGPFSPGEPIAPICLQYPHKFLDMGNTEMTRCIRAMFELTTHMRVTHLPIYHPSEEEIKSPAVFAQNVREVIAHTLNVPVTQHSYEDVFLYSMAKRANVAQDFEMQHVRKMFDLSFEEVQQLLKRFKNVKRSADGTITLQDFARTFGFEQEVPPYLQHVFEMLDREGTGHINFHHFLYGVTLFKEGKDEDRIEIAFKLFDTDNTGYLAKDQIISVLTLAESSGYFSPPSQGTKAVVEEIMGLYDYNHDGQLDANEFKDAILSGKYGMLTELPIGLMKQTVMPESARNYSFFGHQPKEPLLAE